MWVFSLSDFSDYQKLYGIPILFPHPWPSLNGSSREGGPRGLWVWELYNWNTFQLAETYFITEVIWKATKSQFPNYYQELL